MKSYVDLDLFEESGAFRSRDIRIIDFARSNIKIDKKFIFERNINCLEVPEKSMLCPFGPIKYERVKVKI